MIEIGQTPARNLVSIRVGGTLTTEDYDAAIPELERAIEDAQGALNAVIMVDDLRGWDLEALWKELKFDIRHYDDFRRIAVVGQSTAEKAGAVATGAFTSAETRFFLLDKVDAAQEWATSS